MFVKHGAKVSARRRPKATILESVSIHGSATNGLWGHASGAVFATREKEWQSNTLVRQASFLGYFFHFRIMRLVRDRTETRGTVSHENCPTFHRIDRIHCLPRRRSQGRRCCCSRWCNWRSRRTWKILVKFKIPNCKPRAYLKSSRKRFSATVILIARFPHFSQYTIKGDLLSNPTN